VTVDHRAFEARRRVKTPSQLDGIRRAQRAADAAMGRAVELLRECPSGLTAEAVRAAMQEVCDGLGSDLEDTVIVAVGAQAANGHDAGSGPIARGDTVLIDIWPRDRESLCWADMTRTFVAGGAEPPEELQEYWRLSKEALERVTAEVRAGADGRELHRLCSSVFEAAGQPTLLSTPDSEPPPESGFFHGLGHGVGLEVHEAPGLGLAGDPLVAGDVIAVEPGCYRKGFGGVRLEDLLLVTDDGCEVLTQFPYELVP
jgi:Xaa-Pro aminopeptidase